MTPRFLVACALGASAALGACENAGQDRVLEIEARGTVQGIVYLDRDGDLELNQQVDTLAAGVGISLVPRGGRQPVAATTSGQDGVFRFDAVPVGSYRVVVDNNSMGDSLQVARIDDSEINVRPSGSTEVRVAISYRSVPIAEARNLPLGTKVFISGISLNALTTFGDSSIYVVDRSGAIRVVRIPSGQISAGDSVRVLGTISTRDGQRVINDGLVVVLARSDVPPPHAVSTAEARTADGGSLDAHLARITGATILSTETTPTQDLLLTVDDGSGVLEVLIAQSTNISTADLNTCAILHATGILSPAPGGSTWRLKPRSTTDVTVDYPSFPIAQVRDQPLGRCVFVYGVALNAWGTFGDSTLHVTDGTASIRATRVSQSNVTVGDSIRLLGVVSTGAGGHRVLSNAQVAQIYRPAVQQPVPVVLTTGTAARAGGGQYDAALVTVRNANILSASTTPGGHRLLTISDGSGSLDVLIAASTRIDTSQLVAGAFLTEATGVLVPVNANTWQLRPRFDADLQTTFPTVTIAEARGLQAGQTVYVEATALNALVAFSDRSVHLRDATGTIRAINVPVTPNLTAGTRVRLLGTITFQQGQPVLGSVSEVVTGEFVGAPAPVQVSVSAAASANGGALDAQLVRVAGVTVTTVGDTIRVSGGGGTLGVVIDPSTGIGTGQFTVGRTFDLTGVLVPASGGTEWILKPRSPADVVAR